MEKPTFEQEGNDGVLVFVSHFGQEHRIRFKKTENEVFRVGGTAVSEVVALEGLVLVAPKSGEAKARFRAFRTASQFFEADGVLSPEGWQTPEDLHCYVTEYYPLDVEGSNPSWLISRRILEQPNFVYINVDVLDGGENLLRRYRVSPFFGEVREMTW
jgi:hypothetical protein